MTYDERQYAKKMEARTACDRWGRDWGGLKGLPEPTARQIIRAVAACGWHGHPRSIPQVTNLALYARVGWVSICRPATVEVHETGMSGYGSIQMANFERAEHLVERYQRFYTYMTEARHNWREVKRINWADNSLDVQEQSTLTGEYRTRQLVGPSGDVCF